MQELPPEVYYIIKRVCSANLDRLPMHEFIVLVKGMGEYINKTLLPEELEEKIYCFEGDLLIQKSKEYKKLEKDKIKSIPKETKKKLDFILDQYCCEKTFDNISGIF